jgi:hypothetical protein
MLQLSQGARRVKDGMLPGWGSTCRCSPAADCYRGSLHFLMEEVIDSDMLRMGSCK